MVLCLKQFFLSFVQSSAEPKVLQILLLLILTRRKHTYTRGAHC